MAMLHTVATRPEAVEGTTVDLADGIDRAARAARRRGLVAVVSDFLCPSDWPKALRRLAVRNQVLAIEIIDPRELEVPDVGYLTVVDPESGQMRDVHTGRRSFRDR